MTTERLEPIDGANWETFLKAPWAVLMLGKSDCEHCHEYTEELPFNQLYVNGERSKAWPGGGLDRLVDRLRTAAPP